MSGIWSRVRDLVGFNDPVDGMEDYVDQDDMQDLYREEIPARRYAEPAVLTATEDEGAPEFSRSWEARRERRAGSRERVSSPSSLGAPSLGSNVISMPTANQITSEVVVIDPRSFNEMAQVVQYLRERKTVVMNLTLMDPADAQRSVDFVAGGTFAIDGHQERIGENIFLFTPSCVAVSTPSTSATDTSSQPSEVATPIWSSASYASEAVGQF